MDNRLARFDGDYECHFGELCCIRGELLLEHKKEKDLLTACALYIEYVLCVRYVACLFCADHELNRSLIVFGGIGMAYLLYRKTNWDMLPYVVSSLTLM